MQFPINFISATREYHDFKGFVPAPLMRGYFTLEDKIVKANILICGLGFYELYINGTRVSKLLAPYISAPDDIIYYDLYDVAAHLQTGENIIGIVLGNGMNNDPSGKPWEFDKARWRSAPKVALRLDAEYENGGTLTLESSKHFKTNPSPIFFDNLRCGEYYDANQEIAGWNKLCFDDSNWANAITAESPLGEPRLCTADPIVVTHELKPISIKKCSQGYLYDFGQNCAGVCRLRIQGKQGQEVTMTHGERVINGELETGHLTPNNFFVPEGYFQKAIYICSGNEVEEFTPRFTYFGFQYVLVQGISEEQATPDLLTYKVMNSDLKEIGGFTCSDETTNKLQTFTRRSTLANFYYFPTDCPHREKNGWTGDAAVSAEHTLLNLNPEKSYKEWLHSVRKSQKDQGQLPGIVPTGGWGYTWGNGPAWDSVLTYLPYFTYRYRGDKEILLDNATAIFKYLHYLSNLARKNDGLIEVGIGDWCTPGREMHDYKSPLILTDSVISFDICKKAALIYDVLEWEPERDFATQLANGLRHKIRERLIDFSTMTAHGECQTSQAMLLHYDILAQDEKPKAFEKLLSLIEGCNGHMDTGILGARVIFHVLSAFGKSDLAFKMITQPTYPSYGNWIARGATSLWEDFQPEGGSVASLNHHFFGDISGWFIQCIAGIRYNPDGRNHNELNIMPSFIETLNFAEAFHVAPAGKIKVRWERIDGGITLNVVKPGDYTGQVILPDGWTFAKNGSNSQTLIEANNSWLCQC